MSSEEGDRGFESHPLRHSFATFLLHLRMEISELKYWIAFSRVRRIGRARVAMLEGHFGSLSEAWGASSAQLTEAGLDRRTASNAARSWGRVDPDAELERVQKAGVTALTWHDAMYPPRLKEIYDKPPLLYVKGEILPEDERSVAVVGTRRPTAYGREATRQITSELAKNGLTIVSGLAKGVDGVAHGAALDAGARTVAVMGSGLDVMYPREHAELARRISEGGAVVSEFALGTRPDSQNFPRRNRIISGMSLGTLVTEAPEGERGAAHGETCAGAGQRGVLHTGQHTVGDVQGRQSVGAGFGGQAGDSRRGRHRRTQSIHCRIPDRAGRLLSGRRSAGGGAKVCYIRSDTHRRNNKKFIACVLDSQRGSNYDGVARHDQAGGRHELCQAKRNFRRVPDSAR